MISKIKMNRKGFTLIELMIVVAIIGILAAIAIPQFNNYRKRGYNAAAQSALKNLATAQEAYFVDYRIYASSVKSLEDKKTGFKKDLKVEYVAITRNGTGDGYWATAKHTAKGANTFRYNTASGGLIEKPIS